MPFKIDVHAEINDRELTLETCSEIISTLQDIYQNIRQDLYSYFLGLRTLKKALIFVGVLCFLYFLTNEFIFIYLMPVSVMFSLVFSLINAEYVASQSRKEIYQQLQHYIQKREMLLKDQKLKI